MVVGGHRQRTVDQARAAAQLEASRAAGRRYYANHRDEVRAKQNSRREEARPKCGHYMPVLKEHCARRPGHAPDHKSAAGMKAIADRRWAK